MLSVKWSMIVMALLQTIYMVGVAGAIAFMFGLPLGVFFATTRAGGIMESRWSNRGLQIVSNIIRSIPFIILLVLVVPLTRLIVGTSIGSTASIVPLSIAAIPFVGRLFESSFNEISPSLLETGTAMGASHRQIVAKILIPEAMPSLIRAMTVTLISLVGYSAMAGAVGGGGLGQMAINYGYQRFMVDVTIVTVIILVILIQGIQSTGNWLSRRFEHN